MENLKEVQAEARMQEMFDRIAPKYDFLNSLLSMRRDKAWRKHLIKMIPAMNKQATLLDVACGTGEVVLSALQQNKFARYIGIDISKEMLQLFKEKIAGKNYPVSIHKMNADQLHFPDQSIDCITISFGLRNVQQTEKALSEFKRVLKPNGSFLVLDFFKPQNSFFSALFLFYFHQVLPRIGGLLSDRKAYSYLPKSVESFGTSKQLCDMLVQAGFKITQTKSFLFGSCQIVASKKCN